MKKSIFTLALVAVLALNANLVMAAECSLSGPKGTVLIVDSDNKDVVISTADVCALLKNKGYQETDKLGWQTAKYIIDLSGEGGGNSKSPEVMIFMRDTDGKSLVALSALYERKKAIEQIQKSM